MIQIIYFINVFHKPDTKRLKLQFFSTLSTLTFLNVLTLSVSGKMSCKKMDAHQCICQQKKSLWGMKRLSKFNIQKFDSESCLNQVVQSSQALNKLPIWQAGEPSSSSFICQHEPDSREPQDPSKWWKSYSNCGTGHLCWPSSGEKDIIYLQK